MWAIQESAGAIRHRASLVVERAESEASAPYRGNGGRGDEDRVTLAYNEAYRRGAELALKSQGNPLELMTEVGDAVSRFEALLGPTGKGGGDEFRAVLRASIASIVMGQIRVQDGLASATDAQADLARDTKATLDRIRERAAAAAEMAEKSKWWNVANVVGLIAGTVSALLNVTTAKGWGKGPAALLLLSAVLKIVSQVTGEDLTLAGLIARIAKAAGASESTAAIIGAAVAAALEIALVVASGTTGAGGVIGNSAALTNVVTALKAVTGVIQGGAAASQGGLVIRNAGHQKDISASQIALEKISLRKTELEYMVDVGLGSSRDATKFLETMTAQLWELLERLLETERRIKG